MMSKYAEWWKHVLTGSIPKKKKDDDALILETRLNSIFWINNQLESCTQAWWDSYDPHQTTNKTFHYNRRWRLILYVQMALLHYQRKKQKKSHSHNDVPNTWMWHGNARSNHIPITTMDSIRTERFGRRRH